MTEPHVFISYVRENAQRVMRLAEALRASGVKVWLDRNAIKPGADWRQAIQEAIETGSFFIACFSKQYWNRSRNYMNEELKVAIDEIRRRRSSTPWFIPALLDRCAIPPEPLYGGKTLKDLQAVALHADWSKGLEQIVSLVRSNQMGKLVGVWQRTIKQLKQSRRKQPPTILVAGDTPWDVFWITEEARYHQQHATSITETQFDVISTRARPGTLFASASLLREFGFPVICATLLDRDEIASQIRSCYAAAGIDLIDLWQPGASFQRHYILESAPDEPGAYRQVIRINHEPQLRIDAMSKRPGGSWRKRLRSAVMQAGFVLINDTHKGTLSRHGEGEDAIQVAGSTVLNDLTDCLEEARKNVTVLDFRRSMAPYKNIPVTFVAASGHEAAASLDGKRVPSEDARTRLRLEAGEVAELLARFPKVENLALTCGAAGVQQGVRSRQARSITLTNYPAAVSPRSASIFTPHCGDVFDAGLILGLYANNGDPEDACAVARVLAGLQALKLGPDRLTAQEVIEKATDIELDPKAGQPSAPPVEIRLEPFPHTLS
jgi:sugar/nucleoside kinase (ribokinase family)